MDLLIRDASDVEDIAKEKAPPANNCEAFRAETAQVRKSMRKNLAREVQSDDLVIPIRSGRTRSQFAWSKIPTSPDPTRFWNPKGVPTHFLIELATGYALFNFVNMNEIKLDYESADKYINYPPREIFKLEAFHRFPSDADALSEMNAIAACTMTEKLKRLLVCNLPKPTNGITSYYVATASGRLGGDITSICKMPSQCGDVCDNVMRVLRMSIDKLIPGFKPGDLEKAQYNLARLYNRALLCSKQRCEACDSADKVSFHGSSKTVVVPHRFEGVFTSVGEDDNFICTKNLVPGEAFCGDELISLQNEDGSEVEYRVWNPLRSKLAAAIMCGANDIWVKPGSRVLCIGVVCGSTLRHLSDIVGPSGVVYAVGKLECVVNMTEKRSNVVPIFQNYVSHRKYRMLVGMVDIIYATGLGNLHQVNHLSFVGGKLNDLCGTACRYLKAGGKYMISIPESLVDSTNPGLKLFAYRQSEFKVNEIVKLEPFQREDVIVGGVFRMLKA